MPDFSAHPTRVKALLLGHSGVGKTVALASLANAGRPLRILDLDNKLEVLSPFLKSGASVTYETLSSFDPASYSKVLPTLSSWSKAPPSSVVVIDTLSFLGDLCLRHTLHENRKPLVDVAFSKEYYGIAGNKLESIIAYLTGPSYTPSVLLLCHLRHIVDDRTKKLSWQPTTIGTAFSSELQKWLPEIWALDNNRKLHTQPLPDLPMLKSSKPNLSGATLEELFAELISSSKAAKEQL